MPASMIWRFNRFLPHTNELTDRRAKAVKFSDW
jgi:hypothetical protein